MICTCGGQTEVLATVPGESTSLRRRRCLRCGAVTMTVEMPAYALMIIAETCEDSVRSSLRVSDPDIRRMARHPWARVTRRTIRPRRTT